MTAARRVDLMSLDDWRALGEDAAGRSELQEGVLIVSPSPVPRHQLELLRRYGRHTGLSKLSHRQLATVVTKYAHRSRAELVEAIEKALDEQTVMVPGTAGVEAVIPKLVEAMSGLRAQRADAAARIEEMLTAHPLGKVLTSIPGIGVRTAATILVEVGDISRFPTSGHLAAHAGLAPVTRQSGSSIRGEHRIVAAKPSKERCTFRRRENCWRRAATGPPPVTLAVSLSALSFC